MFIQQIYHNSLFSTFNKFNLGVKILEEMQYFLGKSYHFRLASVHFIKSPLKYLGIVRPLPPFWQYQDLESTYS